MSCVRGVQSRLLATRNFAANPNSILIAVALFALMFHAACNHKQPPPQTTELDPLNRADSTRIEPKHFLHKTFAVKKHADFAIELPPHAVTPHLQGSFRSFVPQAGAEPLSDETADVDCLILTADQYDDFLHGRGEGTALYTTGPTHNHEVDYHLPPARESADKYYVVFRRAGSAPTRSVEADFTLSFGD
jgi:hypothetical protein